MGESYEIRESTEMQGSGAVQQASAIQRRHAASGSPVKWRPTRWRPAGLRPALAATLAAGLAALALCGVGLGPASWAQSGPVQDLSTFPRTTLDIQGKSGAHRFNVWVADTDNRKIQGLMFVRDLPADEGMLFLDCCSGIWMRNTYIELDILFVGADGRVVKIAERARPFDETTISAAQPVKDVVELKGGEAAQLGLKVGDRVAWKSPAATPEAASSEGK